MSEPCSLTKDQLRILANGISACARRLGISGHAACEAIGIRRTALTDMHSGTAGICPDSVAKVRRWLLANKRQKPASWR